MKKKLTPEDCTKDELCGYIRYCVGLWDRPGTAYIHKSLDNYVRLRRYDRAYEDLQNAGNETLKAIQRYADIVGSWQGKKIKDIPEPVLSELKRISAKIEELGAKEMKLSRKWKKLGKDL